MISVLISFIGIVIAFIILYDFALGFSLVVATRLLIPSVARIDFIKFDVNLNDFLILFLLFTAFILQKFKKTSFPTKYRNYILLFCISSYALIYFAYDVSNSVQIQWVSKFIFQKIIFGVLAFYAFDNISQIKRFLNIFLFSIFLVCTYGIVTYVIKENPYVNVMNITFFGMKNEASEVFIQETRGVLEGRIQGTSLHPLGWGQIMLLFLSFYVLMRKYFPIKYFWIISSLLLINAFLSGSRSVVVSSIVIFFFVLLSMNLKLTLKYIVLFLFFLTVLFVVPISGRLNNYIEYSSASIFFWDQDKSDKADIHGSSVSMRMEQLEYSVKMIDEGRELTGLGSGFIMDYFQKKGNHPVMLGFESVLFTKIVEQGFLGLFFFALFYSQIFLYIRKQTKIYINDFIVVRMVDAYFLSYLVGIVFTGIQGDSFEYFFLFTILFLRFISIYKSNKYNSI